MWAKSWQTPRRSANDIGGVVDRRGGADLVDEVGLDPPHQIDGAVEHRPPGRKALGGIGADFRIERDLPAREQIMRGRVRRQIGRGERRVANLFPRRRAPPPAARASVLTATRAATRTLKRIVRLIELDPGHRGCRRNRALRAARSASASMSSAAAWTRWPGAVDRREPQHMARIGHRRRVVIDRGLPDVVDHPSASQRTSARSCVVK